jgi:hypothetical protein
VTGGAARHKKVLDRLRYFDNYRTMELESVCFPPPLDLCFPLSYGQPLPQASDDGAGEED